MVKLWGPHCSPSLETMVSRGNHPQMAARFRLVNYHNLPRVLRYVILQLIESGNVKTSWKREYDWKIHIHFRRIMYVYVYIHVHTLINLIRVQIIQGYEYMYNIYILLIYVIICTIYTYIYIYSGVSNLTAQWLTTHQDSQRGGPEVSPLLTGGDVATGAPGDLEKFGWWIGNLVVIYGDLLGIQWWWRFDGLHDIYIYPLHILICGINIIGYVMGCNDGCSGIEWGYSWNIGDIKGDQWEQEEFNDGSMGIWMYQK